MAHAVYVKITYSIILFIDTKKLCACILFLLFFFEKKSGFFSHFFLPEIHMNIVANKPDLIILDSNCNQCHITQFIYWRTNKNDECGQFFGFCFILINTSKCANSTRKKNIYTILKFFTKCWTNGDNNIKVRFFFLLHWLKIAYWMHCLFFYSSSFFLPKKMSAFDHVISNLFRLRHLESHRLS